MVLSTRNKNDHLKFYVEEVLVEKTFLVKKKTTKQFVLTVVTKQSFVPRPAAETKIL